MYKLGESLRKKYNNFLGEIIKSELLSVKNSSFKRTNESLQLVLAGLFPPQGKQKWNEKLNWQPIPIGYDPRDQYVIFQCF